MPKFKIVSDFKPTGDQPQAIEKLAEGINRGLQHQVLLGVTGSGKTFTIAKVKELLRNDYCRKEEVMRYEVVACRRKQSAFTSLSNYAAAFRASTWRCTRS